MQLLQLQNKNVCRILRPALAIGLLAAILALLPNQAHAQSAPAANCEDGPQSSGATYRICMPALWNGNLVVYAHGYVAPNRPVGIPEDQLVLPGGARIDDFITSLGYAFATTGYSSNGLAVIPAQADLVDVVNIFTQQKGAPGKVLLAGVSEGGLIATLLAERSPSVFDGALALCGPYGSFERQVNHIGDFRVLLDYYFPGLVPPSPVDIPTDLLATWETSTYSTTVKPVMLDPANAPKVDELLRVAGVAYDSANPASRERSIDSVLWYNIYGTNDATTRLGGQPYNNQQPLRTYSGSSDDQALNAGVARFTAAPEALAALAAQYQTSGRVTIPVVTLHTTLDPIVPIWQQQEYTAKVQAAGAASRYEAYQEASYGHCAFSPLQVLSAFNRLVAMVNQGAPRLYLPAIRVN